MYMYMYYYVANNAKYVWKSLASCSYTLSAAQMAKSPKAGDDDVNSQEEELKRALVHAVPIQILYGTQLILVVAVIAISIVLYKYGRTHRQLARLTSEGSVMIGKRLRRDHDVKRDDDIEQSHSSLDVDSSLSDNVFESTKSTCSSLLLSDKVAADQETITVKM